MAMNIQTEQPIPASILRQRGGIKPKWAVWSPLDSNEGRMMRSWLTPEMKQYVNGSERNSQLPLPNNTKFKYEVMVQYFCDGVEQHKRIDDRLDQIAQRVGGISSWVDRSYPCDGNGGWTVFRQASNLRQARQFFKEANKYAERCVIYDLKRQVGDHRYGVKSYETETYRRYFNKDESEVTKHKNQNV